MFRLMAIHPRLDVHIAYCSMQGAEVGFDRDFGREIKWDVPLLDGYSLDMRAQSRASSRPKSLFWPRQSWTLELGAERWLRCDSVIRLAIVMRVSGFPSLPLS